MYRCSWRLVAVLSAVMSTPFLADWGASNASPGYVITSDPAFTPRWVRLEAPAAALSLVQRYNGYANGLRGPGSYDICYSLVDEDGTLSPMGQPVRVVAAIRDWQIVVNAASLDPASRACGTMWWYRPSADPRAAKPPPPWYPLGAGLNVQLPWQVYKPYLSLACFESHGCGGHELFQAAAWPDATDPAWHLGASNLPPPPAPSVRVLQIPNVPVEVAYSWRCNDGESPLSPVLQVPAFNHPSDPAYASSRTDFYSPFEVSRNLIPPQGALGVYLYLRDAGSAVWHRQPAPGGGDLWPLDFNRLPVKEFVRSGVLPSAGNSRSWLSSLQLALDTTTGDVVVDGDQFVASPVISPYERAGLGHMFGRRVSKLNGGWWVLRDVGSFTPPGEPTYTGYPRGWPLWAENSQNTHLVGCRMELDDASCGVCFFDHSGGGAFHFRSTECGVEPQGLNTQKRTYGVRVLWESRGPAWNDHSASEPVFRDLEVNARYPVVVEGNQSANWMFETATLTGSGRAEDAVVTVSNSGQVTFAGRLTCDAARCVVAAVTPGRVNVENLFLDQGAPSWVGAGAYGTGLRVSVRGNKVNQWTPWLHVGEVPTGGAIGSVLRLDVSALDSQQGGPVAVRAAAGPRPGAVEVAGAATVPLLAGLAATPTPQMAPDRWAGLRQRPAGWKEPERVGIVDAARYRHAPYRRPKTPSRVAAR